MPQPQLIGQLTKKPSESETKNSLPTLRTSSAALQCKEAYGDASRFLVLFNPSKQAEYTADIVRCYMGSAPSLATVGVAFGENVAESWLAIQLRDLSEFAGVKSKLTIEQADAAAKVLKAEFGYMSVTQLMHFFLLYKGGKYGKFYGAVDPIAIGEALKEYAKDRYDTICRLEAEHQRKEEADEQARHAAEVEAFRRQLKSEGKTLAQWIAENCSDGDSAFLQSVMPCE